MSEKVTYKLTMAERFILLNLLPKEGDYSIFKILRKLREKLAPNEKENEEYKFQNEWRCAHREYDDKGRATQCEFSIISPIQPKCLIHKEEFCTPSGKLFWSQEKATDQAEIQLTKKQVDMIKEALRVLSESKKLKIEDGTVSLYDKFYGTEEEEE